MGKGEGRQDDRRRTEGGRGEDVLEPYASNAGPLFSSSSQPPNTILSLVVPQVDNCFYSLLLQSIENCQCTQNSKYLLRIY